VALAFLVISNLLLMMGLGSLRPEPGDPTQEAWFIYFAFVFSNEPPSELDQQGLMLLLKALDPESTALARNFTLISYSSEDGDFELMVRHTSGKRFRIARGGVFSG
jgi:hypothetical protein